MLLLLLAALAATPVYVLDPPPTPANPRVRLQVADRDACVEPLLVVWTNGSLAPSERAAELDATQQFEVRVGPGASTVGVACAPGEPLTLFQAVMGTAGEGGCRPPRLAWEPHGCEGLVLVVEAGRDQAWWLHVQHRVGEKRGVGLERPVLLSRQRGAPLTVLITGDPGSGLTPQGQVTLTPLDARCSPHMVALEDVVRQSGVVCSLPHPGNPDPSSLSWADLRASWVALLYYLQMTVFFMMLHFDVWDRFTVLAMVYEYFTVTSVIVVFFSVSWTTYLFASSAALVTPFVVSTLHAVWYVRSHGTLHVRFPSKRRVQAWQALTTVAVLSGVTWSYQHARLQY